MLHNTTSSNSFFVKAKNLVCLHDIELKLLELDICFDHEEVFKGPFDHVTVQILVFGLIFQCKAMLLVQPIPPVHLE